MLKMFLIVDPFPPPLVSVVKSLVAFGLVSMAPQINRNSTLYVRNHYKKLHCFVGYCLHRFIETPGFTVLFLTSDDGLRPRNSAALKDLKAPASGKQQLMLELTPFRWNREAPGLMGREQSLPEW